MSFLLLFADAADKGAPPEADPGTAILRSLPMFLMMGVLFYFLLIRPQMKQEKERKALVSAVRKNDEVVTAAGIIGTVAKVDENEVVIKIDENANVRMRVLKSSIVRVVPPKDADGESKEDKKD